ncbi:hypothetical protein ASPZODRAFT_20401 [Penicilliopsis zonata CBS 506.65]|uniref:Non-haem dioxygenase N-terminal domain-containing protein n=1 Tax=Penicilliopsis zonata CBS 506.65 TaxID=1073090 RepID=A0A1L9S677_9EURO|nr:hypothetical protein ASPZODRAFT_20401 [Penicilliopsis zonata CBS 506.65]OJJ42635.1 hypothetical protein ASPZODRAFT_20401 [Penicilliopsis zonata CBS 506.65]
MAILSLDYRQFTSGSKAEREEFAHTLLAGFMKDGFAKLHSHTFNEQEVKEMFLWSHKFFDLPMEAKNKIPNDPGPRPMRGYTP